MEKCRQPTNHYDGLVQDCSNSIANALELLQSCTKPSVIWTYVDQVRWLNKASSGPNGLTHWGKIAVISHTTFSNVFSWMKTYESWLISHWSLFLRVQLRIFQHWFRSWLGADQATSHYLNELEQLERLCSEDTPTASWLPILLSHIGSQVKRTQSQSYKFKEFAKISNMKWIRRALLKIQSGHNSVHRRTDGQGETSIPPFQLSWSWGYNDGKFIDAYLRHSASMSQHDNTTQGYENNINQLCHLLMLTLSVPDLYICMNKTWSTLCLPMSDQHLMVLVISRHGHETCLLHCYLHYGEHRFEKVSWIPFIIENDYWNLSQVLNTSGVNINKISQYENCLFFINSLWPSDAIWGHRCGSTLAQVMFSVIILACCLMVPSHYLN